MHQVLSSNNAQRNHEFLIPPTTEILILGGGTGGVAAALAACEMGAQVVMTEPTAWIGGQLTQQAVPPDENRWIESGGSTFRYRQLTGMFSAGWCGAASRTGGAGDRRPTGRPLRRAPSTWKTIFRLRYRNRFRTG